MRNRSRARVTLVVTTMAAGLFGAPAPAHAALASPLPGQVIEGTVQLTETAGGNGTCQTWGAPRTDFMIIDQRDDSLAGYFYGWTGGPRTAAWDTTELDWEGRPRFPNGGYLVRSIGYSTYVSGSWWGGYTCLISGPYVLGEAAVTVHNWRHAFQDARGRGTVRFNLDPVEEFRYEPAGRQRYARVDEGSSITALSTPGSLRPDPACAQEADPCSALTQQPPCSGPFNGCSPRFITVSHQDDALVLAGVFDLETGAFAAQAVETVDNTTRTLSRGPSCVTGPDGQRRCLGETVSPSPVCATEPTSGDPVCVDGSAVVPPVTLPNPALPQAPCVFHPVSGDQLCLDV